MSGHGVFCWNATAGTADVALLEPAVAAFADISDDSSLGFG
jgi:hypothetical protein